MGRRGAGCGGGGGGGSFLCQNGEGEIITIGGGGGEQLHCIESWLIRAHTGKKNS